MTENDRSRNDDKPNDAANDEGRSKLRENELSNPARWKFGSFTFLNLVSSAAIILGIGTAVLFARVYYDQRLGAKVVPEARPTDAPVEVPVTIDGWEGDIGYRSADQVMSDANEAARLSQASSSKPIGSSGRDSQHESATEKKREEKVESTKERKPIEQTTSGIVDKAEEIQAAGVAENLKETNAIPATDKQPVHTMEKPGELNQKREEELGSHTEQLAAADARAEIPMDRPSQGAAEKQSAATQLESEKPVQVEDIEVDMGDIVDAASKIDPADQRWNGRGQQQKSVEAVLHRAANISDVEDMYQWVLDDAEVVGIKKVLSALKKGANSVSKVDLAKACLLDRLSVIEETESNVESALDSLAKLAQHVNSTLDEKMFAHRKMAEKRLRQGIYHLAISHMRNLVELDPQDVNNWIELGTYHLYAGEVDEARRSLETALEKEPGNGLATLSLGSLLMLSASQGYPVATPLDKIAEMLAYGLNNTERSLHESRYYAQLYDALLRSGRESEASQYMKQGVNNGILLSEHQLCQSYVFGHATKPLWAPSEVTYNFSEISQLVKSFTDAYGDKIEYLPIHPENPFLVQTGLVEFLELFVDGERLPVCESSEETVALCDLAGKVVGNCSFCDSYVLKMSSDASYWKQSGMTNLGLRTIWILSGPGDNASLTLDVGDESHQMGEQKFLIFDHSYLNRLRANATDEKGTYWLFAADSWHPNLDEASKESTQRERF